MKNLLNEEYFHIGTNEILKELWVNIQTDQIYENCLISYGGLFTSHQNKFTLSDWISYKIDCNNYDVLEFMYSLKSILIKYKEDSKFLSIRTENDYKNLKDSGFIKILKKPIIIYKYLSPDIYTEVLDYEKISSHYDLLYIDPYSHKFLNPFSVNTMYALNSECIDYYRKLEVDYDNHKILEISDKTYIKEPSNEYTELVNYIRSLFHIINSNSYEEFIYKLSNAKNTIEKDILDNGYGNLPFLHSTKINKEKLVNVILRNIYREKYIEEQKRLLKK